MPVSHTVLPHGTPWIGTHWGLPSITLQVVLTEHLTAAQGVVLPEVVSTGLPWAEVVIRVTSSRDLPNRERTTMVAMLLCLCCLRFSRFDPQNEVHWWPREYKKKSGRLSTCTRPSEPYLFEPAALKADLGTEMAGNGRLSERTRLHSSQTDKTKPGYWI